jgi:hypothetical protein
MRHQVPGIVQQDADATRAFVSVLTTGGTIGPGQQRAAVGALFLDDGFLAYHGRHTALRD